MPSFCCELSTIIAMHKMSPFPTVPIALRIRAGRIPVSWTMRDDYHPEVRDVDGRVIERRRTERVFWPKVETTKWGDAEVVDIEGPLDIRAQLFNIFNTNWNEKTALAFLEQVGAWRVANDGDPKTWTWAQGMFASVAYGHRQGLSIRVLPISSEDLRIETQYWYKLLGALKNPAKLRAVFKQAPPSDARPHDHFSFALEAQFNNTLPISLEWHGKDPYAVVETITASELMVAAAWADVVGRAEEQICARCGTRFTWPRKKKHCQWECGHLEAVRKYKRKKAIEKQKEQDRRVLPLTAIE
jgi:hypothetical protein